MMGSLAVAVCFIGVCGTLSSPDLRGTQTSKRAARAILAQQTTDGAITMATVGKAESSVIPYFGCFAAGGLLDAYHRTKDPEYLLGVRKWVDWYAAHQNPNGTIYDYKGHSGTWQSTGHYDSSDSYAAVYLTLLREFQSVVPDVNLLKNRRHSIELAVAGIRLTMQPCGLTIARPDYPVMYTMDNVETLLGLRDAAKLAKTLGDRELEKDATAKADRMEAAIDSLFWDESRSAYRAGVQIDGGKMQGLAQWYPDVMANLMAIAWLPSSERNRSLYARLLRQFGQNIPQHIKSVDDLEKIIWWAWAAKGVQDRATLLDLQYRLSGFDAICKEGCDAGNLGHIAALTSQSP